VWEILRNPKYTGYQVWNVNGDGMSSPLSVPPGGTGRKGRKPSSAFMRVEAIHRL